MATTAPKLSSGGAVKIRFSSMDRGTTKWKEGTFEILEKDNKVNLCLRFNCGGASKTFQVLFHLHLPNNWYTSQNIIMASDAASVFIYKLLK